MLDIQGGGYLGIALEAVQGVYQAPTKFFPIRSESLQFRQDTNWRRVIRGVVDVLGAVAGAGRVEGDIEMELLEDVLPYFLQASRNTVVKSGTGPYTYTTTPGHGALPAQTLSITVVRAGIVFGYTGCIVGSMNFSVDNGLGIVTMSMFGRDEADQSTPASPAFSTVEPYGMGKWNIQVPTATQIFDADTFSFQVEDNASAEIRLKDTAGAAYARYGERSVTVSMDRDFTDRAEYDAFKSLTAQSITIVAQKDATHRVSLKAPVAIKDTYDVSGLAGQGDLVRASIAYQGVYDPATSKAYEIVVITDENIV